jgi:alanyl-tRNA synthetase
MRINNSQELRKKFLDFFQKRGHAVIPSAALVPQNDASVLFTTAGMHPLVPFLLGAKHPAGKRLVNVQKCLRTTDIDDVGDNRHLTFFEMLGFWSLGDYFKEQAIPWTFEFFTSPENLAFNPEQVYVSVFSGDNDVARDQQSIDIWKKVFLENPGKSIAAEFSEDIFAVAEKDTTGKNRIFPYGREKNWWQAGEKGPAGPDTEMFYDTEGNLPLAMRVKHAKSTIKEKCHINCDCGRFIEIGNDVFMQFNGIGNGKYEALVQKNVDVGWGFERLLTIISGQTSVFDTDLFKGAYDILLNELGEMTNDQEVKARIIIDHVRAATFMVSDDVLPSNKDRGYVLRRILRRAMVHAKLLGLKPGWLEKMLENYISFYKEAYPELTQNRGAILDVILEEEKKFGKTLEQGLREFRKIKTVSGKDAFDLFQSFGIPWEITKELALQYGQKIDKKEFEFEFKKHQEISRTAAAGKFKGGLADHSEKVVRLHTATHLMQAALRKVLGATVFQKGSNITNERSRFDFTYQEKMTAAQIKQVEDLVNEWISKNLKVQKDIMTPAEARTLGAIGLFGEKYGETVSVYTIMDKDGNVYSREFCGGPHVENTGTIGQFKISKEEAVSAGVRRIKAVIAP